MTSQDIAGVLRRLTLQQIADFNASPNGAWGNVIGIKSLDPADYPMVITTSVSDAENALNSIGYREDLEEVQQELKDDLIFVADGGRPNTKGRPTQTGDK